MSNARFTINPVRFKKHNFHLHSSIFQTSVSSPVFIIKATEAFWRLNTAKCVQQGQSQIAATCCSIPFLLFHSCACEEEFFNQRSSWRLFFLCFRCSNILSGRSHAQTSCVIKKGLYLHNSNTHKRNTFQYNLTVPPGGQTVLLPQCHRMFFLLSPFICCFFFSSDTLEMSSKSNIFIYEAVWCVLREHGVSSRTRKIKGRNVQMYSGSFAEVLWHEEECKKIVFSL